ncbi:hypothetical protein M405DRAFT_814739 [Rhizopogon salebrosus TDB-379]|nr:hypothetical protein M405DRAFT_814739 [Rhizopogon salebrosus TDB-379]
MAKQSWDAVTSETIKHCWDHTQIQSDPTAASDTRPHIDPVAWKIVHTFATTQMSLPDAERDLQAHLGERYIDLDWRPALKAVMDAEGDTEAASNAINTLKQAASRRTGLKIRIPTTCRPRPDQLLSAEAELMQSVNDLKARNRIFGELQTVDEILDPAEERDMGEFSMFEGGDKAIADEVRHEIAIANGKVIDIDSDSDDDEDNTPSISRTDILDMCQRLEVGCMQYGDPQISLNLSSQLRIFRAKLRREELMTTRQASLDQFFSV